MRPQAHHYAAAGLTAAFALLYLATLSPNVAMWDAGEYIAAAKTLGIPHQPGNPLFLLIAHAFGLIPLAGTYAVRINVLAALSSAVAGGLWFLCAEQLLRTSIADRAHRFVAAGVAATLSATAFTVWNQSVVMEKVYPLALVGLALGTYLLLRWLETEPGRRADRLLVLIAYVTGLTYAVHPAGLLTGPATAVAVLLHRPQMFRQWKLIALLAVAFIGGSTPFAVLPIRAAHQPYINESAISACEEGTIAAGCTFSVETARRLKGTIQREQYGGNAVLERRGPLTAQTAMYWLYFRWQWFRDLSNTNTNAQSLIAAAALLLGLAGLASLKRDSRGFYFGTLAVTFTLLLIYYLNFRYGYSQSPELESVPREPRDRDYFFMWTFSIWGVLAGLGVASLTRKLKPLVAIVALAAVAALPLSANWTAASRSGQGFTTAWAKDLLMSLEPNAIIITNGDNDSFPLWYAQAVEGVRLDVTVTLSPYLGMDWYARQLNRRAPVWKLTNEQLDSVPELFESRDTSYFEHGQIRAKNPPRYFTRDQLLVLWAIRDSFPGRPLYFSSGGYAADLGLAPYLKQVGLVSQLMPTPLREGPDTVRIGERWVDLPRTLALWKQYAGAKQVVAEGRWVDPGSANIPVYYAATGYELAQALQTRGRGEEAKQVMELVMSIAEAIKLDLR